MAVTDITPPNRFDVARKRLIKNAFGSSTAIAISVVVFALLAYIAWLFLDWAVFRAIWSPIAWEIVQATRLVGPSSMRATG